MTEDSDFTYVISINTDEKTVHVATMRWFDKNVRSTIRLPIVA